MPQPSPEDTQATRDIFPRNDAPTLMDEQLWRIPLPLPFALRAVNVYLIGDGAGHWTLFDAGLGLPRDEAALRAGLRIAGVPLEAISALVLTHAHPDHIGLSGLIQRATGAPVYMLAHEDEDMYAVWGEPGSPALVATARHFAEHGLALETEAADPRVTAASAAAGATAPQPGAFPMDFSLPPSAAIQTITDDETLTLGRWTYRAIWTPGHSDYHMCLLRSDGLFIAGDHILPSITPNIGYYPDSRPDPLGDYYASLLRVRDLPARVVAPGHGLPFATLAERADALREHHIERSAAIRALVERRPEGFAANDIASELFGERLRTVDDRRFALAETLAHLEHLRANGHTEIERADGLYRYRPTAIARRTGKREASAS
ncbi:MAG TPA: MBL fold metallo-hydrolase [Ktedonobacterales bacterium]